MTIVREKTLGDTSNSNPEIGHSIVVDGIETNYHDIGQGEPVLFIHGSGPGVSAWVNWRLNLDHIANNARCVAPDMVGFGYTPAPNGYVFNMQNWVNHLAGFVRNLDLRPCTIVGNSFGGALALAYAIKHPSKVKRLVLMGSVGVDFELTPGLDAVWGYEPSVGNMKHLLSVFAFNQDLVNDDLAELRYQASIRPGAHESYSKMFPEPRQKGIEMMKSGPDEISRINIPALILHGVNDKVIPVGNSHKLFDLIPNAELHLFKNCGHWTQIEKRDRFNHLVSDFLETA